MPNTDLPEGSKPPRHATAAERQCLVCGTAWGHAHFHDCTVGRESVIDPRTAVQPHDVGLDPRDYERPEPSLPPEERCCTCGATPQEFCHLEGNHDDAYELGTDHGANAERARIERILEDEMPKGELWSREAILAAIYV